MLQITQIMPYVPVENPAVRLAFVLSNTPDIGFYNLFFPLANYIEPESKMYRVENLDAIIKSWQRLKLGDQVGNKQRI